MYGKCIGARYTDVERGMCEQEFQAFKKCMLEAVSELAIWRLELLKLVQLTSKR